MSSKPFDVTESVENSIPSSTTGDGMQGISADQSTLPKGYFYSPFFLGTMAATGLGLGAAVGGFSLAAPNLALINKEIGPDPNINWMSLVYILTLGIGLLLVGRLSDLFGRRVEYISRKVSRWLIFSVSGSSSGLQFCPLLVA